MITNEKFAVGTEVGCEYRWPYHGAHPDCWAVPHKGVVLALDDPRAWRGSIAFPRNVPTQEECTAHVQSCLDRGLLMKNIPVLWQSSVDPEQFMQWDAADKLRPYAEELAAWEAARAAAYSRETPA